MAKDTIPATPIPVGDDIIVDEELYCASFMNYSDESYSDTTKELLRYLETEYDNTDLGGSTRSFIAHNSTVENILESILNEKINGINKNTIDKYLMLSQSDNDVIIFAILY